MPQSQCASGFQEGLDDHVILQRHFYTAGFAVYITLGRTMTTLPHIQLQNQYGIPRDLASLIVERDRVCIYCKSEFAPIGPRGNRRASWEHIINDVNLITPENIAICCTGCNSSKSDKDLRTWLQTPYCKRNSISEETLAPVALAVLQLQIRRKSESSVQEDT